MPPTLSYRSKAQREKEEREEKERQEAEKAERERREAELREAERAAAQRARAPRATRVPAVGAPPPAPEATPTPRRSVEDPRSLVMFEEDAVSPTRREIDDIEMLGPARGEEPPGEEGEVVEEVPGEVKTRRVPPRRPKSPDMRPVYVGFILTFTGLAQFLYGLLAMWDSPHAATGPWAPMVRWGAFSMGFAAAFLGLLAIRGGLWSFRKERFGVVKVGAIAATVCVWAWWVPWLFGLAALVIIQRAQDEYYPHYDPRWDSPEWARPPEVETEEGIEEVEAEEEGPPGEAEEEVELMEALDEMGAAGPQEAQLDEGDGWEDLA